VVNFNGSYECKIDAKGRVLLPSALKKQLLSHLEDGFVLKRSVFENCLELYPMQEWNNVMKDINKLNRFKKKNTQFIRAFTAGVKLIELDGNGRLLVPKDLIAYAKLSKNLVLNSTINIIEIWDKDLYEASIEVENFGELAEEVMGNTDDTE
jgi:MraZ protein